ncbi:Uncharacterised protein [Actinobacillus pleuropneumoniae]|nr:Uncharacterised protein [Actinobacillus pleuropneumoniae]
MQQQIAQFALRGTLHERHPAHIFHGKVTVDADDFVQLGLGHDADLCILHGPGFEMMQGSSERIGLTEQIARDVERQSCRQSAFQQLGYLQASPVYEVQPVGRIVLLIQTIAGKQTDWLGHFPD